MNEKSNFSDVQKNFILIMKSKILNLSKCKKVMKLIYSGMLLMNERINEDIILYSMVINL